MTNLWKQEYLLNLDEIDEQHQHFFKLCSNMTHLADIATCKKEFLVDVIRSIGALRTYAFLHFKTEEETMLKFGYPEYLSHTGLHNTYLEKMMEYETNFKALLADFNCEKLTDESLRNFLLEASEFIVEWWTSHIISQDVKYAVHIKEKREQNLG